MASTHRPQIDLPMAQIKAFCHKWGVVEFALFGSVVRDDFGPDSDVDVMVKFAPNDERRHQGWGMVDMKLELEDLFGRRVDIVEDGTIENPFRRQSIESDLTVIHAA